MEQKVCDLKQDDKKSLDDVTVTENMEKQMHSSQLSFLSSEENFYETHIKKN